MKKPSIFIFFNLSNSFEVINKRKDVDCSTENLHSDRRRTGSFSRLAFLSATVKPNKDFIIFSTGKYKKCPKNTESTSEGSDKQRELNWAFSVAREASDVQKVEIVSEKHIIFILLLSHQFHYSFLSETSVTSPSTTLEPKRRKSSASQDSAEKHLARVTEEDLTTEGEPSEYYWKGLAEKRREVLEVSLKENQELYEKVESLEEELSIARQMLEESKNLVEVLTEMIQENENNDSGLPTEFGECSSSIMNSTKTGEITDDDEDIGFVSVNETTVIENDVGKEKTDTN